jgi:hypothetical protein
MADFRKWFMVLAVVLIAAATASAQVTCTQNSDPTVMRQQAITDFVGEVSLNCTNAGANAETAQFVLSLNSTVTNALAANESATNLTTEAAALLVPCTAPGCATTEPGVEQSVQGIYYSTGGNINNALRFPSVSLPAGSSFLVRFVNVRADTTVPYTVVPSSQGNEIVSFLSASLASGNSVVFTNPTVTGFVVGFIEPAVKVSVTDCGGGAATAAITLSQCQTGFSTAYGLTFQELQQTAFKTAIDEVGVGGSSPLNPPVVPTTGPTICEGTFAASSCGSTAAATVSNGVQLTAAWTVPAALVGNVHVWVTSNFTDSTGTVIAALDGNVKLGKLTTGPATCLNAKDAANWVELADAGVETAVWDITTSDLGNLDSLTFGWAVSYVANTVPSGTAGGITLQAGLGPWATFTQGQAPVGLSTTNAQAEVVRFTAPPALPNVAITIQPCVTNLLFPYVTNVVGYDTGIEIANTSWDPFGTATQTGTCTLILYGSASAQNIAGAGTKASATTSVAMTAAVAPGQVFADTLENIFALKGTSGLTTESGYVIATCNFQYAHGFAYIVSPTGAPQGYLALVMGGDLSAAIPRQAATGDGQPGSDEMLSQ